MKLNETVDTGAIADRVGVFSIQGENPGLLPSLKKEHHKNKRSKVEYSPFSNDKDARTKYITGELDNNGQKKKIKESIKETIEEIVARSIHEYDMAVDQDDDKYLKQPSGAYSG